MSRRRVKPRSKRGVHAPVDVARVLRSDGEWFVRPLSGSSSTKDYTCPDCHQAIRPATPHVVVWPVEKALLSHEAIDERRHWHHACWNRKR